MRAAPPTAVGKRLGKRRRDPVGGLQGLNQGSGWAIGLVWEPPPVLLVLSRQFQVRAVRRMGKLLEEIFKNAETINP